ncbi:MAG TPA: lipoyl(octanoyl) transferase LipB [Bacteroidota bacterium]|nr:lipoyl(octanoyl) transferase LipB [Bacteroidota bacterium]
MNQLLTIHIGRTRYAEAWELQRKIFSARLAQRIPDVLLLTEHEPVYTLGKGADANHLLANDQELRSKNIDLFNIDRGGDVTFHGPGQLVGYPILDLNDHYLDIHRYLRDIEEVLIRTAAEFGIRAQRSEGYTGVWAGNDKLAAIGVKVSRWVTMHGFALNVNTDLSYFDRIIPCGIFHKGITSLQTLLGHDVSMQEVERNIIHNFESVFSLASQSAALDEFLAGAHLEDAPVVEEKIS